ncbi:MAG: hypothetical protein AB9846_06805 [Tenuifilaceae bacterium]
MRIRFRFGPLTFGKSGTRLSIWRGGTGFSIPLFNRKARSFGKVRLGIFSFYFRKKSKNQRSEKSEIPIIQEIKKTHKQAYEPWSAETDEKLVFLYRQGKTVKELSEIFGRTKGGIRSRINKLLLQ